MGAVGAWLARRVRDPLVAELRQGATPEGLANSAAVGAAIGLLPFLGVTTFLCFLAGRLARLNHVALQTVNYLLYPAQIALIVPFVRLGEAVTGAEPMPLSPTLIASKFAESPAAFLSEFGMAGLHGALGWALVMPAVAWLLGLALRGTFRRLAS
jgi:uncharacterized protein (DUF2062 family)